MTKVNIISGFLGAGKTTLIKKLLKEVYADEQVVLIENEFGEIGIDGGFLQDAGVEVTEMNSGFAVPCPETLRQLCRKCWTSFIRTASLSSQAG